MKIKSILIANRGEIAIRIAKTAKRMGIKTTMFLTHQEPNAYYLDYADEVVDVSNDTFINVFMNVEKIVDTALQFKIDAIHPGYGFLSENPFLPKECEQKGITFIGPSHTLISQMGNKGTARKIAIGCDVPVLEGSIGSIPTLSKAYEIAEKIGFPVIIKAVAGGGGKGMRVAKSPKELPVMFNMAVSEAKSVFGNASVFIEKYIENPKHIEFQILADKHGNLVHLFERECSIQRKHQKLLEEAPSPTLDNILRQRMGSDAIKLCKASDYYNAGTVEFLIDENLNYYFMEMNTRIQVEHPVTEAITGIDIVEQQIRIAQDEKLGFAQEDIQLNGCAIEFRINAEDVQSGFSPSMGIIDKIEIPENKNIRVDTGFISGSVIPMCYDSLVAKLIISGDNRQTVLKHASRAIKEIKIRGIKTTLPFFKMVLQTPAFKTGNYTTSFIENELPKSYYQEDDEFLAAVSLAITAYMEEIEDIDYGAMNEKKVSPWILSRFLKG
jgi:acetyl-CoA carboxylase, biotin carboxylase subunit